jgi:hypothetical protein
MSTFTNRELELLASLRTNWRTLYARELTLLLNREDDGAPASEDAGRKSKSHGFGACHFRGGGE